MKKIIGISMFAIFIMTIMGLSIHSIGFIETLQIMGITFGTIIFIIIATYLTFNDR